MAFTPEVKARLSLDNTPFQRALTATVAQAGAAGQDIGKKLQRSFGAGDVFKGLLQGIGIGSLETIVDRISDGFRTAAEQAERIAESAARSLGIYEKIFASRRSDEQNLAANRREQARLQKELADANRTETKESRKWNAFTQRWDMQSTVTKAADPEKAAEIAQRLAELSSEEVSLSDKIAANKSKAAEATQQEIKQQETGLQRLEDQRREFERSQLSAEDRLRVLHQERAALAADEDDEYESQMKRLARILELDRQIAAASAERLSDLERAAQLEKQIADTKRATQADLDGALVSTGRLGNRNPRGRGRTETERIADRAARYEAAAEDALMKGDQVGARNNSVRAASDYKSAGSRIEQAGALIPKEIQQSLGNQLIKANTTLKEIRESLKPTAIKTGSASSAGGKK